MCKFCCHSKEDEVSKNGDFIIDDRYESWGTIAGAYYILCSDGDVLGESTDYENGFCYEPEIITHFDYCPMCGKKLKKIKSKSR